MRMQAHMGRLELPISDYIGDTKSALDNSVRMLQARAPASQTSRLPVLLPSCTSTCQG
jgi:hypothetical protein